MRRDMTSYRIPKRWIFNAVFLIILFSGKAAIPVTIGFIALFWYLRVRRRRIAARR